MFLKYSVSLRKNQGSLQMFLVLCGNSNLDVLINFVLIKKKCSVDFIIQNSPQQLKHAVLKPRTQCKMVKEQN